MIELALAADPMTDDELFDDAIAAEAEASPARWRAADCYAELHGRGYSTRQIGERVGKSQPHIVYCLKVITQVIGERGDFQAAYDEAKGNVHFSSDDQTWETPQDLFDLLDAEFGFTLDVCATSETAKCELFYAEADDGLAQTWEGVCWMNPPYGRVIGDWMRKAHESATDGTIVVCLVPARTDTDWWWEHSRYGEIRFLRGRLRFGDADSSAPFPSAIIVFGRKPNALKAHPDL